MASREEEDVLFEAEAAMRRQEADLEEVLKVVAEAQALTQRARAELDQEADASREDRENEEAEARSGELGAPRRDLQRRLDRDETTWAEILSGRDVHASAEAYRAELGRVVQQVVEQESEADPEFREGLERMGRYRALEDPPVRLPDWPEAPEAPRDGREPVDSPRTPGSSGPATTFGTW